MRFNTVVGIMAVLVINDFVAVTAALSGMWPAYMVNVLLGVLLLCMVDNEVRK